jgi:hypothetical protein
VRARAPASRTTYVYAPDNDETTNMLTLWMESVAAIGGTSGRDADKVRHLQSGGLR